MTSLLTHSQHPARHELPWKHLASEASDSLSRLGVVKPVKRNRWETVALTWSFCPCYLRNSDLIFSWVGLTVYSCNYMLISVVNVINTYMSCNLLTIFKKDSAENYHLTLTTELPASFSSFLWLYSPQQVTSSQFRV